MKHNIRESYIKAAADQATAVRIYERVLNQSANGAETAPRKCTSLPRRIVVIAAVVAALVLLATGGYAAYQRWHLPEPVTYERVDGGIVQEYERNDYTVADTDLASFTETSGLETDSPFPGAAPSAEPKPLTDEVFIQKGLAILNQIGMLDLQPEQLTVIRQENLYWGRQEAVVVFDQGNIRMSVKYNAVTGRFLGMNGIDWQLDSSAACSGDAEAEALARRYYEALPVEQGYVMAGMEKYDAQYWSYDFCREIEPGVCNPYEMVRVAINPVSGRLTGCNVFYVPLLDDHEPGQARITQEQAEAVVRESIPAEVAGMHLTQAEVRIVFPNWIYTEYGDVPNRRASDVSRWAWVLNYDKETGEFTEQICVYVDCWTGEILGGDATK